MKLQDNPNFRLVDEQLPRIAEKLKLFWGCAEFDEFVNTLLSDTGDGTRRGFPREVARALYRLAEDHDGQFPQFSQGRTPAFGMKPRDEAKSPAALPTSRDIGDALRDKKGVDPIDRFGALLAAAGRQMQEGVERVEEVLPDVSVLFVDLVGFTELSTGRAPKDLLRLLHRIFSIFDRLIAEHGVTKIKTIGDAYLVAGGAPRRLADHLERTAALALAMRAAVADMNAKDGTDIAVRIGLHVGPVIGGLIGVSRPTYDLWGETVNLASRLEGASLSGCIQVSAPVRDRLQGRYLFVPRGRIPLKGLGEVEAYLLEGPLPRTP